MCPATPTFRLLSTPPAPAAWNMALDAVLLEHTGHHLESPSPPTVRLMRFSPQAVLVGAYQSVEAEVRLDWCRAQGIDLSRRVTGGGTILFDESQVGWEVICRFEDLGWPGRPSEALFVELSRPIIAALAELGIEATYRPRNDIEVQGRKISGTGGTDLHGALLFQGTLLVDFDVEAMVRALRVPVEKLRRQELEGMRDRVTWVARELGRVPEYDELEQALARGFEAELGVTLEPGELTEAELQALEQRVERYASPRWVFGRGRPGGEVGTSIYPTDGGVIRATVRTGADRDRVQAAVIDGDFFASPRRAIYDLEARLKGASSRELSILVTAFCHDHPLELPGLGPEAIVGALLEALERARWDCSASAPAGSTPCSPSAPRSPSSPRFAPLTCCSPTAPSRSTALSATWTDATAAVSCTIGEAYLAGEAAGLSVRSITSFEHLMDTLDEIEAAGSSGYVGSCCEAFYRKHRRELESVELPGLLFDVSGAETCYDLGKSAYAYRGDYEGKTEVDLEMLERLLSRLTEEALGGRA